MPTDDLAMICVTVVLMEGIAAVWTLCMWRWKVGISTPARVAAPKPLAVSLGEILTPAIPAEPVAAKTALRKAGAA